jgi:hypothetical protein
MTRKWIFPIVLVLVLGAALLGAIRVAALAGYTLDWWTVDGGGGSDNASGTYTLGGTIGQPDTGVSEGGTYTLAGGFWGGGNAAVLNNPVYLPLITR